MRERSPEIKKEEMALLFKPPPPGTKTNWAMLAVPPKSLSLQGGSQHLPSIKVEKPTLLQEFNEEGFALFCTQYVTLLGM